MGLERAVNVFCSMRENEYPVKTSDLCRAMKKRAGDRMIVKAVCDRLGEPLADGYLLTASSYEVAVDSLDPSRLQDLFLLDGAMGPSLNRYSEAHEMLGGFCCSEWFQVRDIDSVRYPVLRIEVADALGFERLDRFSTEHYAQYSTGLGLAELLVTYIEGFDGWRRSRNIALGRDL